ncbi:DUF481 domain-containing protein [Adhaeribacter aquaticus]|uniref:DUF481 domain-containing protein n=1 Tax=Adhaeribacter aquaticus TaxID=299567 RepID=UPI0004174B45|nr:DUF481 domain-containing protein [Adhaeribacter aquaticus]
MGSLFFRCFPLFILLSAVFLFSNPAKAQIVNIEQGRLGRDTSNYFVGKVGLDFSMFNQNAGRNQPNNYLQFLFNSNVTYNSKKHTYILLNYFNYLLVNYDTKEQRNTVAQQGYSHFRVNFYEARRLSYELFTQAQADRARGLRYRSLLGSYLRFRLFPEEDKKLSVYLGTGVMREHEEWRNPERDNAIEVSNLIKSTSYASAKLKINQNVESAAITYYQVGYSSLIDRFRNRVSGNFGLNFKVNKLLSFKTSFNYTYEDAPIVPVTKFVYSLTNGFIVQF